MSLETERGEAYAAEMARIAEANPEKARIIEQYQKVAGKYEELWREIYARTENADWKEDGIGSCHTSPQMFETWLSGIVTSEIEGLWDAILDDSPEEDGVGERCAYHRLGRGCILGSLKSPRCLSHIEPDLWHELDELGIELPGMRTPLEVIQSGAMDLGSEGIVLHPEANEGVADQAIRETEVVISRVRQLPLVATDL